MWHTHLSIQLSMQPQAFFEKYAQWAMEQQQKYGIPASVILAQAAIESSWGESKTYKLSHNMFGIHATKGWIDSGKPYIVRDDMGMVEFCQYGKDEESFEHHSRFLMENKRYAKCFTYSSDDHASWAQAICDAGYAYRPPENPNRYAKTIESIISSNHLEKYDQMALADAQTKGFQIGYMRSNPGEFEVSLAQEDQQVSVTAGNYSFPISGDLVMTDGLGKDATSYRGHTHNGIDLRANYVNVLATEDEGKVVGVGSDATSGKYVIVVYDRPDGSKWRVSYCHLSEQKVAVGDSVSAGQTIGVSGNSGNSTGPHLHLTVKHQGAGQTKFEAVDPLGYLAEIAVAGQLEGTVTKKDTGEDLLAEYKEKIQIENGVRRQAEAVKDDQNLLANISQSNDPTDWLALLMAGNGSEGLSQGGGFHDLISTLFMGVIALAMQLDRGEFSQQGSSQKLVPALSDSKEDQQLVIDRRRNGADVAALRQNASLNFDIGYPDEQQTNSVRLA